MIEFQHFGSDNSEGMTKGDNDFREGAGKGDLQHVSLVSSRKMLVTHERSIFLFRPTPIFFGKQANVPLKSSRQIELPDTFQFALALGVTALRANGKTKSMLPGVCHD